MPFPSPVPVPVPVPVPRMTFIYSPYPASLPMVSSSPTTIPPSESPHSLRGIHTYFETINSTTINKIFHLRHSELVNMNYDEINKIIFVLFGCIILTSIIFAILYIMLSNVLNLDINSNKKIKAKQSPFIVPSINTNVPQYLSLDSSEKGVNSPCRNYCNHRNYDSYRSYRVLTPTNTVVSSQNINTKDEFTVDVN